MATQFSPDPERGPASEDDFAAWAFYQAMLVRSGRLHLLDRHGIAEELDILGAEEFRTLDSLLAQIIEHMLKWDRQPERRGVSWVNSIEKQRSKVRKLLADNPSRNRGTSKPLPKPIRMRFAMPRLRLQFRPASSTVIAPTAGTTS